MTVQDIKKQIIERECDKYICENDIKCYNCKYWAYNNGGIITSVGSSKCTLLKKKTDSYQFCRRFEKKVDYLSTLCYNDYSK